MVNKTSKINYSRKPELEKEYILIGRCSDDKVVKFASYWADNLISKIKGFPLEIIDLKDENFTQDKISKHIY